MSPEKLNSFFWHWREYRDDGKHPEITQKLQNLERSYTRRDLGSRFQRYIIDVDWLEWDEGIRERHDKPKTRVKILVRALALRISKHPELLTQVQHLLTPAKPVPALWYFGEQLAQNDGGRVLLPVLTQISLEKKHQVCLQGYLEALRASDTQFYLSIVKGFLSTKEAAWLGTTIALRFSYDDDLFANCLDALERRWIEPHLFSILQAGKAIESIPPKRTERLLKELNERDDEDTLFLLVELLSVISFNDSLPFNSDFVFGVVSRSVPGKESRDIHRGFYWKKVCLKLIKWDGSHILPLLDIIISEMETAYRLSYDHYVVPVANELVQANPPGAWKIVKKHLEKTPSKWSGGLSHWLKGGFPGFDEKIPRGAISNFPVPAIMEWIKEAPETRAALIAHAVPASLDDEQGGRLTQELLHRYGQMEDVQNAISATFHSGGYSGPRSAHLKRKRYKLRHWLAARFEIEVTQWIEKEIEYLDKNIVSEEIDEERERFD